MIKEIKELLEKLKTFEKTKGNTLPSEAYYLTDDEIICFERGDGDSRFPYAYDGLTLWAYSSGTFKAEESMYNIFHYAKESKEPTVLFFVGNKEDENYTPVSLTSMARQPMENGVKRFVIYSKQAAYYFAVTDSFTGVLRATVNDRKQICFTVFVENTDDKIMNGYVSAYFNPVMSDLQYEDFEAKWYKSCTADERGYCFEHTEYLSRELCLNHYLAIAREGAENVLFTSSKNNYVGQDLINCSKTLFDGNFAKDIRYTEFTETAIAGDIVKMSINPGEHYEISYVVTSSSDKEAVKTALGEEADTAKIDAYIENRKKQDKEEICAQGFALNFEGGEVLNDSLFGKFLDSVRYQVDFCSKSKNYAGAFIGIRDIFQQIEAVLIWNPSLCRRRIVDALNYIDEGGRPPRQYSYPQSRDVPPKMDLRPYIDQGVWIISTVYSYLAFTGDYTILDELCGYYKFVGNTVELSDKRSSVLCHLTDIMGYLISNIDENTGCLKAIYGDWNDALDGLGKTDKEGEQYGNGVSVMATLQLYKNCDEMAKILSKVEPGSEKIAYYNDLRSGIERGLLENAVIENGGLRKILHGWGDDKSFYVGSFSDSDGENRNGLTASAFWIICEMYKTDKSILKDILSAYAALDSKYGLKTFEPYFPLTNTKVGRICHLPKGTAENGATYIHATLFGIQSLFAIGEDRLAWEQLYKILPLTHSFISTTPFVMPNSYIYNEEKGFDGQSMSDWFTGSGCVMMKALVKGAFGVEPTLDGVKIAPAGYIPFDNASIDIIVKGCKIHINVKNNSQKVYINGEEVESGIDADKKTRYIFLTSEELKDGLEISYQ